MSEHECVRTLTLVDPALTITPPDPLTLADIPPPPLTLTAPDELTLEGHC